MTKDEYPDILLPRDVCNWLGIQKASLYRLLRERKIPAFRVGAGGRASGKWRFMRNELAAWISAKEKRAVLAQSVVLAHEVTAGIRKRSVRNGYLRKYQTRPSAEAIPAIPLVLGTCRTYESATSAATKIAQDGRCTDIPDYIAWTLTLHGAYSNETGGATVHQEARELVVAWHPVLCRIVDEADVSATYRLTITAAQPVAPWRSGNVTLLGDAIHNVRPSFEMGVR